ncbi:hypothetical protein LguiA_030835 [Lonicera macranthoides]
MGPMCLRITTTIHSGLRNWSNIRKIEFMSVSRILDSKVVGRGREVGDDLARRNRQFRVL